MDDIKAFMSRAMKSVPKEQRHLMEAKIKKIIVDAFDNQTASVINWTEYPIPKIHTRPLEVPRAPKMNDRPPGPKTVPALQKPKSPGMPPSRLLSKGSVADSTTTPAPKRKLDMDVSEEAASRRRQRFQTKNNALPKIGQDVTPDGAVVGRCLNLEKGYLRLTSAPKPELVRPLGVLEEALDFVVSKFRKTNEYSYIVSQLKSIRQDLKVQQIENHFTVEVYKVNARIALENEDLGELNQCLSQLWDFYTTKPSIVGPGYGEFIAYSVLYSLYTKDHDQLMRIFREVNLSTTLQKDANVMLALKIARMVNSSNQPAFFYLAGQVDKLSQVIVGQLLAAERLKALAYLTKAAGKTDVPLTTAKHILGYHKLGDLKAFIGKFTTAYNSKDIDSSKALGDFNAHLNAMSKLKVDIKGQF